MSYIKEPQDIDFVVAPSVLTNETKSAISSAIANYRETSKKAKHSVIASQNKKKAGVSKTVNH